jgi:hypothetical protein
MVSLFKKALESGKFVVTSEVAPPKGANLEKTAHHIELLKGKARWMPSISRIIRVLSCGSLHLGAPFL